MANEEFDRPQELNNRRRQETGPKDEGHAQPAEPPAPSTDDPETITLGGMTFRRISDEEGEASFWRNEEIIARKLGITFNPPEEADSTQAEINLSSTSDSPSLIATNPPNPAKPSARPVPPGLVRCPVCNEYRGTIGIDDESPHSRRQGDFTTVQCICDGILCPRCKVNRIHRPISNVWDERGGFGHIPYFAAMGPCNECRAKREAEDADRKRKTEGKGTLEKMPKEESK